jgi:hypothetical protein
MRIDPIRLNFYQGTGAYAWQLAEYLQHSDADDDCSYELSRAGPPILLSPFASYPEFLAEDVMVRWSVAARIIHNAPQIIGERGVRSSLVVVDSAQAFAGVRHGDAIALEEGVTAGALSDIEINGRAYDARKVLVTLHRHGLIDVDREFTISTATHYVIEPTCILVDTPEIGCMVINQLNGRMIRLNEMVDRIYDREGIIDKIPQSLQSSISKLVEAGILRLISVEGFP